VTAQSKIEVPAASPAESMAAMMSLVVADPSDANARDARGMSPYRMHLVFGMTFTPVVISTMISIM
jgi:hypothetical protein